MHKNNRLFCSLPGQADGLFLPAMGMPKKISSFPIQFIFRSHCCKILALCYTRTQEREYMKQTIHAVMRKEKMNMKKNNKKVLGFIAVLLAAVMVAGAVLTAQASGTLSSSEIDAIVNTETDASLVSNPFTAAVAAVRDSVVLINNYQTTTVNNNSYGYYYGYGFGNSYGNRNGGTTSKEELAGTDSGTVVSQYGHILTNYHVIEDASRVTVSDGENEYEATVVVSDESTDIAVLLCPEIDAEPVTLGDSDQLQAGEWAIVIGNPLGEDFFRSTTVGVVSALEREVETDSTDKYGRKTTVTNSMIQVDAAISSGNSGGGMFNVLGQLMGIPSLKYTSSYLSNTSVDNIGMCIPINVAKPYIRQALEQYDADSVSQYLAEKEKEADLNTTVDEASSKPRLGVSVQTLDSTNNAVSRQILPKGCLVISVEENSPAEAAGIQAGDIIVDVDGTVITSAEGLQEIIFSHAEGDTVQVKVYRAENVLDAKYISDIGDGEYIDMSVTLQVIASPAA